MMFHVFYTTLPRGLEMGILTYFVASSISRLICSRVGWKETENIIYDDTIC